ncbi:MAG TPA: hypothetical protein VGJ05_16035 [Fimbriiglobus sp.]|jgi:hypothetical protein
MSLRRIATAYGTSLMSVATTLLGNFWLLKVVAEGVDKETFGAYAFVNQVTVISGIVLLGLDAAAGIRVAEALGRGDQAAAARVAFQLRWFCRGIAVLFACLTCVAVGIAFGRGSPNTVPGRLWAELVAATGLSLTIGIIIRSSAAVFTGAQLLVIPNLVRLGQQFIAILLGYTLFRLGFGIVSIPMADCGVAGLAWFVLTRAIPRFCPWIGLAGTDRWLGFSGLLSHGVLMSLSGIGAVLEYISDPFILRAELPNALGSVAKYALWFRLPSLAFTCCMVWAGTALPSLAAAYAKDFLAGRHLLGRVLAVEAVLASAMAFGIGMWLPAVVAHWLPSRYGVEDGPLLAALFGVWVAGRSRLTVLTNVLYSTKRNASVFGWMWVFAILKCGLGISLVRSYALPGLATASVAAALVISVGMSLAMWWRGLVPWWSSVSLIVPVALGVGSFWAGRQIGVPSLLYTLLGIGATGSILAVAGGFVLRQLGIGRGLRVRVTSS